MDELKAQLMAKANLSPEQAQQAVEVVTTFLKEHATDGTLQRILGNVPGLGEQMDKLPGGLSDKLGGLFGKRE